ncbi:hypothetical protein GCM10020295_69530 [Streptomyces cinereospinus]
MLSGGAGQTVGMTTGAPNPSTATRPRRSRLRTFLPLGVAAWLVLEIWLLTLVADAAGGFTVFLLLAAGFVLGAAVVKRAGRRAFQNLNEALQRGVAPSGDGRGGGGGGGGSGLMMLGGLLLILPGPVSDAAGLLLLLPPGPEGRRPPCRARRGPQTAPRRARQPRRRLPAGPHAPPGREGRAG